MYDYIDVFNLKELPPLNSEFRYLDFLGGTKQFRCYIVPQNLPRNIFLEEERDNLDPILKPIYIDDEICIGQDSSYAVPGFYIISLRKHYKDITKLDYNLFNKINFWVYELRKIMKDVLKLDFVNVYYEEKNRGSANVHYWLLPIIKEEYQSSKLHYIRLVDYLDSFDLKNNRSIIEEYNNKMRDFIKDNNIANGFGENYE